MMFEIEYHADVVDMDIPKLDESVKKKIKSAIEDKLVNYPQIFGKPLRRSLRGYLKLRVGDYRVIFRIIDATVKILVIQHRSEVYRKKFDRL